MRSSMSERRKEIRQFLRNHYDDNHLGRLRRACQQGRVIYSSTRLCLLGRSNERYDAHDNDLVAKRAETLFREIGSSDYYEADTVRNKELLVIVEKEMILRCRLRQRQAARRQERVAA